MRGVDADFQRLQPVALEAALESEGVGAGGDEAVERREGRRLAFAEPREQHPALFHHRVGLLPDALRELAALGFGGRLEALAGDVEEPAVKGAAQPAVFPAPVGEVGAAVRAVPVEQPVAARLILEKHEVLAQQPHRTHRALAFQFLDERDRLPVVAQQAPAGRAGSRAGHQFVLLGADHGGISFGPAVEAALYFKLTRQ